MVLIILRVLEYWQKSFYRDTRTNHLPLVGPPWPIITIGIIYLLFANKWGPAYMKNRKPFNVQRTMQCYNIFQVILNAYIVIECYRNSYNQPYFSWTCQEYNPQDMRPSIMMLRYPTYAYHLSKFIDLCDTVFFVLRKRYNQITYLHLYHHCGMLFATWIYMTLTYGGHFTVFGIINSFIHVCMYFYYFLSAAKWIPAAQMYYWKRTVTQMQILQLSFCAVHLLLPITNNWCNMDLFWIVFCSFSNALLLTLFLNFYIKTYILKPKMQKKEEASVSNKNR